MHLLSLVGPLRPYGNDVNRDPGPTLTRTLDREVDLDLPSGNIEEGLLPREGIVPLPQVDIVPQPLDQLDQTQWLVCLPVLLRHRYPLWRTTPRNLD